MSDNFQSNLIGSAVANFIFGCIIGIGIWIKSRLNKSNCKVDCGIFECDSSISELKRDITEHQETQRGMLKEILVHLGQGTD